MREPIISVENLSKRYRLRHEKKLPYITLRDALTTRAKRLFTPRCAWGEESATAEDFWALKDVYFEIDRGDVVGIIGRNGAGKSTLLKILSRITEPTAGRVSLRGRVASLLEVGTGFHAELSGRENIFLNGAILGMSKAEIRGKFDEIVAFAEVDKFLDTPVKHYSSGMYVRLAFAVAAHLEPEILIIDEVLAVGDADFQKKSLGKMGQVAAGGRTVLFVSHNMVAVQKLCNTSILLQSGHVVAHGPTPEIVANYTAMEPSTGYFSAATGPAPRITAVRLVSEDLRIDKPIIFDVEWFMPEAVRGIKIGLGINMQEGARIFDTAPEDYGLTTPSGAGSHKAVVVIPPHTLAARSYAVSVGIWCGNKVYDHVLPALTLCLEASPQGRYVHQSSYEGMVCIPCTWQL